MKAFKIKFRKDVSIMKCFKTVLQAILIICVLAMGNAFAQDTATIDVTAEVLGTCSFDTTSYSMDFGQIDPTGTGDVTANVTLSFTCTNGSGWTLDDVSGNQTMTDGGTNSLAYSIGGYTTSGTGTGNTQTVLITGSIADTAYGGAVAANYTDTLTININP